MIIIRNIATVAEGFEEAFEARFEDRARRVEGAEGFIRFELQRRRNARFERGSGFTQTEAKETRYEIMTWWRREADFYAWTRSAAFREAHKNSSPPQMFTRPLTLEILDVLE